MDKEKSKNIVSCRLCDCLEIDTVISLGEQYITSRFTNYGDWNIPKTKIDLCICKNCRLLQLLQTTNSSEMYEHEYGYRSGISNTMRNHLFQYQQEITSLVDLNPNDVVLDIGSNDCTMLNYYEDTIRKIGVDPTGKQFEKFYKTAELLPTYFTLENFVNKFGEIKCKVVSSISMFYDLPKPLQFAKDIYQLLTDDGIWTCEQSYLPSMLKTNSIDTICHEHLEYYSLKQIKLIADLAGFKIFKISFNECNGGSFRIYFTKRENNNLEECAADIQKILQEEEDMGLSNNDVFQKFMNDCDVQISKLKHFVETINKNGKKAYVYGASTKGNCLLQYANLGEKELNLAVERNPRKIGKMTNTGIRIIGEEEMRSNPPDFLLVLPWHFRTEIIEREQEFLKNGGQLIFPFPTFKVVSHKEKVLVTGCDGMLAHFYKDIIKNDANIYGITKKIKSISSEIIKFECDVTNEMLLEKIIQEVCPNKIIHFAGISNAGYSLNHPVDTIMTNGLSTVYLCEIIHRNNMKCKLFNASSSEIYKGHNNYHIRENDTHTYHLHPYSIAKTTGHNMIKFYREQYKLPFFNGIIFTTESYLKSTGFLLNKVASYINKLKNNTNEFCVLKVGSLDSYRVILHAKDVAKAIKLILDQDEGNDYNICGNEVHKVVDLVLRLFELGGFNLKQFNKTLVDETGKVFVEMENKYNGYDNGVSKITGDITKLNTLGWTSSLTVDDILKEMIE